MTQLEKKQEELIELLKFQAIDLSMMSKIEFGDDVIKDEEVFTTDIIPKIYRTEMGNIRVWAVVGRRESND